MMDIYFKLFHSIKQPDEIELAKLEILSLIGENIQLEPIKSSIDLIQHSGFSDFIDTYPEDIENTKDEQLTFQRYVEYQTAYCIHGFFVRGVNVVSIDHLVRRLAYSREIYCLVKKQNPSNVFTRGRIGVNMLLFKSSNNTVLRAITDQYYWEGTEYISKISTSFDELNQLDVFIERLKSNLVTGLNRIPASTKARVGKRFLDYLAERQEPSQYLFHGLHPYKGKFHPKLARAFLNIVYPQESGKVMDNFSGSGTLLIEAAFLGLDSIGIDVNPMSVLMGNARLACFHSDVSSLSKYISRISKIFQSEIEYIKAMEANQDVLEASKYVPSDSEVETAKGLCNNNEGKSLADTATLKTIMTLANIIRNLKSQQEFKDILMLSLAIVISRAKQLKKIDTTQEFSNSTEDILRRVYIFSRLREIMDLTPGQGRVHAADTSDLTKLDIENRIDAIVNSPPYSTALDYIRNDLEQLVLLGFVKDKAGLKRLEEQMGGNPKFRHDADTVDKEISLNSAQLASYAIDMVQILQTHGREDQARRLYKFYELMAVALVQMKMSLKPGSLAAVVIGNNLFKLTDTPVIQGGNLIFNDSEREVKYIKHENNVKSIHQIVVRTDEIPKYYNDNVPIAISEIKNSSRLSHQGIYVEIENDRAVACIAEKLGFELDMLVYRYLEKTRRGDVRWETVVLMKKPLKV